MDQKRVFNRHLTITSLMFPVADANTFLSPYEILLIAQENKYLGIS